MVIGVGLPNNMFHGPFARFHDTSNKACETCYARDNVFLSHETMMDIAMWWTRARSSFRPALFGFLWRQFEWAEKCLRNGVWGQTVTLTRSLHLGHLAARPILRRLSLYPQFPSRDLALSWSSWSHPLFPFVYYGLWQGGDGRAAGMISLWNSFSSAIPPIAALPPAVWLLVLTAAVADSTFTPCESYLSIPSFSSCRHAISSTGSPGPCPSSALNHTYLF